MGKQCHQTSTDFLPAPIEWISASVRLHTCVSMWTGPKLHVLPGEQPREFGDHLLN